VETAVGRRRRQRAQVVRLGDGHPADYPRPLDGYERWLLARRSVSNPDELAFYLGFGPAGTTIDQLVKVAGARWAIEECFQTAKSEIGLDQYQVRRYDAWYRHTTLAMLAHAYLTVTTANTAFPDPRTAIPYHLTPRRAAATSLTLRDLSHRAGNQRSSPPVNPCPVRTPRTEHRQGFLDTGEPSRNP
jgi:hypothetical protein